MADPMTTIERFNDMLTVKQIVARHIEEFEAISEANAREAWLIQKVQGENKDWKPDYIRQICQYALNNPLNLSSLNVPNS